MCIEYTNSITTISIRVTGELVFQPPTFYADLAVFEQEVNLPDDMKKEIINFIENGSENRIGTKIIFYFKLGIPMGRSIVSSFNWRQQPNGYQPSRILEKV